MAYKASNRLAHGNYPLAFTPLPKGKKVKTGGKVVLSLNTRDPLFEHLAQIAIASSGALPQMRNEAKESTG